MIDISPLNKNILIVLEKSATVTEGGIHQVTGEEKSKRTETYAIRGKIIRWDPELKHQWLKEGITVWVSKWEGQHLPYNGKEYLFIKIKDVLGSKDIAASK